MTINYTVDHKYVVTGVSANYGTNYSNNGNSLSVSSIIRPASISINTKLKQQKINFDANGGSSITLYAQWEDVEHTVTYKADGETVCIETVEHGKDANLPTVPAKNGCSSNNVCTHRSRRKSPFLTFTIGNTILC